LKKKLDPALRPHLVCPLCRGELEDQQEAGGAWLVCRPCGRRFPIERGIPRLVMEESSKL
jgi:uncharacterized protein YbaR (Trm112 family)